VIEQRTTLWNETELSVIEVELCGNDIEACITKFVALEQNTRKRRFSGARPT
jgi:hypothetical protein